MPNASNTDAGASTRSAAATTSPPTRAVIAVQGPTARARLAPVAPEAAAVGRFRVAPVRRGTASPCVVAGTGYTGEDGVEIAVPADARRRRCGTRCSAPASTPAGLGARDTLRLEAGLPLHGHELGPGITPLQAGLGWVVGWDKGDFRGRGAARGRAGARASPAGCGASPPRAAARPAPSSRCCVDGEPAGVVTSGNFSPVLGHGIALAFLPPDVDDRRRTSTIDVRGDPVAGHGREAPVRRPPTLATVGSVERRPAQRDRASGVGLERRAAST